MLKHLEDAEVALVRAVHMALRRRFGAIADECTGRRHATSRSRRLPRTVGDVVGFLARCFVRSGRLCGDARLGASPSYECKYDHAGEHRDDEEQGGRSERRR